MVFYAGCIIRELAMENPTIVVLTDRNDLDNQLFSTFSRCQHLLRQSPVQADSRADLRSKLSVESGGVVFTTIQKFFPEEKGDAHPVLSPRPNIVVIADEAHRSQYDFIDGFARHLRDALPQASFVGFTGTPIERQDANTRAVFGDYISIYDIQRSVEDGATVPIYYESRLAKLALNESERPLIDPKFEEVTEGEEVERKEKIKTKWAQLEALVGTEERLKLIAKDIVQHFEQRLEALDGKAMVVCMSRRICIDLYRELVSLRPDWHSEDDMQGAIKVVMTGSASDPLEWQPHIRNKPRREALAKRFRAAADPLHMVIVRDMWLTGFDAPSLHTMYVDKPMRGHGLMQAIARVNRVFKDKPGGSGGGLPRAGPGAKTRPRHVHRERRHRANGTGSEGGRGRYAGKVRGLLWPVLWVRPVEVDQRYTVGTAGPVARRSGTHLGTRRRERPLRAGRARAVPSLCLGRAARGRAAHPGRRGVLPSRAIRARQERPQRRTVQGGYGPRGAPDHLAGRGFRGSNGHLCCGRAGKAGPLGTIRRISSRGKGDAAAQPRRGTASEAAQG